MAEEEAQAQVEVAPGATWAHGLTSCMEDKGICCKTMFCPCVVFGKTAELGLGESYRKYCICVMLAPIYNLYLVVDTRRRLREQRGIEGSCCPGDFFTTLFCGACTLCQEAREVGVGNPAEVAPAEQGESMARE